MNRRSFLAAWLAAPLVMLPEKLKYLSPEEGITWQFYSNTFRWRDPQSEWEPLNFIDFPSTILDIQPKHGYLQVTTDEAHYLVDTNIGIVRYDAK